MTAFNYLSSTWPLRPPESCFATLQGDKRHVSIKRKWLLFARTCSCRNRQMRLHVAAGKKEHGSGDAPRCLPCETGGDILRAIEDRGGAVGDTGFAPPVVCISAAT